MQVPTMAEMMAKGETPEVLFWVGCAGSFDQRAQKITKAFVTILNRVGTSYAILGKEESVPAIRPAGPVMNSCSR
jgi:heterodisulfide reductase subunit D